MSLAEEYLAAAEADLLAGRTHVAFEAARHATELAGKARLLDIRGDYPKQHDIGRLLAVANVVLPGVSSVALDEFLAQYLRGRYGDDHVDPSTAREALRIARLMVANARGPGGPSS